MKKFDINPALFLFLLSNKPSNIVFFLLAASFSNLIFLDLSPSSNMFILIGSILGSDDVYGAQSFSLGNKFDCANFDKYKNIPPNVTYMKR